MKAQEYLSIPRNELLPAIDEDKYVFQQGDAPSHWTLDMRAYLNDELANRWVGRATTADNALLLWPPCVLDLTSLDFFLLGFVKGKVYYPPLATPIEELSKNASVWQ